MFDSYSCGGRVLLYRATRPDVKGLLDSEEAGLKDSALTGRGQVRVFEPDLVVRPLLHGGLLRHLTGRRFLSMQRCLREVEISDYLRQQGIRTPQILGIIVTRRGPWMEISVVSELVPDSVDLLTWLEAPQEDSAAMFARAGALIRQIHHLGVFHADCHVKNMLVDKEKNLWIIDLDKAHRFSSLPPFMQKMNLRRFVRSCRKWQKKGRIHLPPGWQQQVSVGAGLSLPRRAGSS